MRSFRSSQVFGEAMIVAVATGGFFWLASKGMLDIQSVWSYVGFFGMIVVFYFALLLCRMIFFYMIGGDSPYPWWEEAKHWKEAEKHSFHHRKTEDVKKAGKK